MKSELELVREFSELNEAKVDSWGALPASSEKRFRELKAYFEDLMTRRSTERIPLLDRHESFEIRNAVPGRSRLRIPAEMSIFFCHDDAYAPARSVNLSRGGLFVGSVPNLWVDETGRDPNPHHFQVFDRERLLSALSSEFDVLELWQQNASFDRPSGGAAPSVFQRVGLDGAGIVGKAEWLLFVAKNRP